MSTIRRIRTEGERAKVTFDAGLHPGIVHRCALCGDDHEMIADRLGVTVATLHRWAREHAEVADALDASREADGRLVEASVAKALGPRDPETGGYLGGDPRLLIFLLESRLGYDPKNPMRRSAEAVKERELAERLAEVTKVLESLAAPGVGDRP